MEKTFEKYVTKLKEAGFVIEASSLKDNVVLLELNTTLPVTKIVKRLENLLSIQGHQIGTLLNDKLHVAITIDESTPVVITDQDRIFNKLSGRNKSLDDKVHIQRFLRTVKDIYDIDMSYDDYQKLNDNTSKYSFKKVYEINGQVALASFVYNEVVVYCIFGNRSDRNKAGFKTAWPSIYEKETQLAVPDKLAIEGVNRQDFTQMVQETLSDKKKFFENLKEIHKDSTDREIFETIGLDKKEKSILKRYLRSNYIFTLEDAIYFTIEKFNRTLPSEPI